MAPLEVIFSFDLHAPSLPLALHSLFEELQVSSGGGVYDAPRVEKALKVLSDDQAHVFKQLLKDYNAELEWSAFSCISQHNVWSFWMALDTNISQTQVRAFFACLSPFLLHKERPVLFVRNQKICRYWGFDSEDQLQRHELMSLRILDANAADAWNTFHLLTNVEEAFARA